MIALAAFAVPQWFFRDINGQSTEAANVLLQEMAHGSFPAPQTVLSMTLKETGWGSGHLLLFTGRKAELGRRGEAPGLTFSEGSTGSF